MAAAPDASSEDPQRHVVLEAVVGSDHPGADEPLAEDEHRQRQREQERPTGRSPPRPVPHRAGTGDGLRRSKRTIAYRPPGATYSTRNSYLLNSAPAKSGARRALSSSDAVGGPTCVQSTYTTELKDRKPRSNARSTRRCRRRAVAASA